MADAGPLIALARLDGLPLLASLFSKVWITETVLAECKAGHDRKESHSIQAAIDAGHLNLRPSPVVNPAWVVDAGEATSIAAALEMGTGLVMDDRAGRRLASSLGLPVIGALGVLVLAKRNHLIPSIRPLAQILSDSGYYLADSVIEKALEMAGESTTHGTRK